jgi:hypothetical protein
MSIGTAVSAPPSGDGRGQIGAEAMTNQYNLTGCCKCGATKHREDDSPVTWSCVQCGKLICRTCTLTIPHSNPIEYYEDTYCSDVCRVVHEGDGSIEAVAQASVADTPPVYVTSVDDLRRRGWRVASHYDTQTSPLSTFWLFARGHLRVSGEGSTDAEALTVIEDRIRELGGEQWETWVP